MFIGGIPACPRCGRRPRKAIPAATKAYARGRRWYGYCKVCLIEAEYDRRQNLMRVSAEERELLLELRQAQPAGRHHARLETQMGILARVVAKGVVIGIVCYPLGMLLNVVIR